MEEAWKSIAEKLLRKAREIDEALSIIDKLDDRELYLGSGPSFVEVDPESARQILRSLARTVKRGLKTVPRPGPSKSP